MLDEAIARGQEECSNMMVQPSVGRNGEPDISHDDAINDGMFDLYAFGFGRKAAYVLNTEASRYVVYAFLTDAARPFDSA